ncbi:hypothetical protein [Parafrankia soli]|uniref:hypothetical protein n=1 Tax=Parafrankia soli TaxID=2599596 RepID=UPI0018E30E87|nr:hypothetical protein [Parafrankia soli]
MRPALRVQVEHIAIVQVRGGKFQVVGGTKKDPFVCWSNANRNWSDPKPTPVA